MGENKRWPCGNCGSQDYFKTWSGRGWEYCNKCADICNPYVPDVYYDGKPEHGLADDPKTGKPMVFSSKQDKAAYLKMHGLVEAGDKIRGGFATIFRENVSRETSGGDAKKALARVRQMGRDVRRQEFLRIQKESGRKR